MWTTSRAVLHGNIGAGPTVAVPQSVLSGVITGSVAVRIQDLTASWEGNSGIQEQF